MTGNGEHDRPMCVLYVDDDNPHLILGKRYLERSGKIRVLTSTSGSEALNILDSNGVDAIVSDYQMPGMDGISLLKEVRSRNESLPFVLLTGRSREEIVIEALNLGADFYLQKGSDFPSLFAELEHKISQAVGKRRAEALVRESRQMMLDVLNFLPDATFAIDTGGRIIVWNRAIEEMTGVSAGDMLGKCDREYSVPFYGARRPLLIDFIGFPEIEYNKNYVNIRREGNMIIGESVKAHPRGRECYLWAKASPLYDSNGTLIGAIETIRDVTANKEAVEKMKASEERYRLFVETAHEGVWAMDEHFVTTFANQRLGEILGYSATEIVGKTITDFMHPDEMDDQHLKFENRKAGLPELYERRFLHRNGHVVWGLVAATPLLERETFRGSFAMITDITGRKESEENLAKKNEELLAAYEQLAAEEEEIRQSLDELGQSQHLLRTSEQKYRQLFTIESDALFLIDNQTGQIMDANPAAVNMYGYSLDELLSMKNTTLSAEPDETVRACRDEVPRISVRYHRKRDGTTFPVEITASYSNYMGKRIQVTAIRDISERFQMMKQLEEKNKKLALLNSITRHDIINSLSILEGYLEFVREPSSESDRQESLAMVDEALAAAKEILKFTKDYQRLGMEHPVWQDLNNVINRALGALSPGKVKIVSEFEQVNIYADPLLVKVFSNLCENSLRHGEKVTRINITTYGDQGNLLICVEDDGTGIPEGKKEDIFKRKYYQNTGLGLFLTSEILSMTGLTIRETGIPGEGARFEITVPAGRWRAGVESLL